MSATASHIDDRNNPVKQESPKLIDKNICYADLSANANEDLEHSIITLAGRSLHDSPYWHEQLRHDARGLQRLTLRYVTQMKESLICSPEWQDMTRDAIWDKLTQLLSSKGIYGGLPSIVFNERPLSDGTRRGVIDLVFSRVEAYDAARPLKKIDLDGLEGEEHIFSYRTRTRMLPGNILAVQCIGLAIDEVDPHALLNAFTAMSFAVGTVVSLAKIVIDSDKWHIRQQFSGVVRFYVEIKPDNMAISWSRLIKKMPTHARINGFPYALSYANRDLHREDVFSSNYTVPLPDEKDSKASIKRARAANEASNSSTSRKRKVKKQEEEEEEEED